MSTSQILTAIDQYKDLAIECALQTDEQVVKKIALNRELKLDEITVLISNLQKEAFINELAVINECNKKIIKSRS